MNNNLNLTNSLNSLTDRLVILPKNPDMFFVFWQISDARTKLFVSGGYKPEIVLKIFNAEDKTSIAEFKFKWNTFKAYVPCPRNVINIYAVAFVETVGGSAETLAESNILAICSDRTSGTQNFLTDNSEYYKKAVV